MKKIVVGISIWVLAAFSAIAQDHDVKDVIKKQLTAFQVEDFEQAFSYASPNIQAMFSTPQRFEFMVSRGYPMILDPAEYKFKDTHEKNGTTYQYVWILDQSGNTFIAEYTMLKTDAGWKIDGVNVVPQRDIGI